MTRYLSCLARSVRATSVLLTLALTGPVVHAAGKPSVAAFRGDGTGVFADARTPTQWDHRNGANVLWKVPMDTPSPSTPAVAVGRDGVLRVFTMADPDWLLCFDGATGMELGRRRVDARPLPGAHTRRRKALDQYEDELNRYYIKGEPRPK